MTLPTASAAAENGKCSRCRGSICCRYVTQQIDTPKTKKDFDFLLWQVSHRNVEIYKDEDGWFLMFVEAPCEHLLDDGRCAIYERRPEICRGYANDYCEYDSPAEEGFQHHFRDHAALEAYCKRRFRGWGK